MRRGGLYGLWVAATFAAPLAHAVVFPHPAIIAIAAVLLVIHIVCSPNWRRKQREFLCSTSWAREQGYTPERLRMFTFRAWRRGLPRSNDRPGGL